MGAKVPVAIPNWRKLFPPAAVMIAEEMALVVDVPVGHFFDGHSDQQTRRGRQRVMARMRQTNPEMTLQRIAELFRVDHSLVIYALKRFPDTRNSQQLGQVHRSNLREDSEFLSGA